MRLLVTRPLVDAMPLAEQLAGQGHDVLVSPLINIELDTQALVPPAAAHGGLAFTSANGVRAFMAQSDAQRVAPDEMVAWQQSPVFAVGPQTAAAAQAAGFTVIHQAAGELAALAHLIDAHYDAALPVLHIAGRHRSGDLAALLDEKAVPAQRAVLYRAEAAEAFSDAARAALSDAEEPVDGVLLYSQRSATIFLALYKALPPHSALRPTAYCLAETIADTVREAGFVAQAPMTADSAALLDLLAV